MDSRSGLTKSWQRWEFLFIFTNNQLAMAKICCLITVGNLDFFCSHLSNSRLFILKGGGSKTLTYIPSCYFELDKKARSHHESPGVTQSIPVVMGPTCYLSGMSGEKGGGH